MHLLGRLIVLVREIFYRHHDNLKHERHAQVFIRGRSEDHAFGFTYLSIFSSRVLAIAERTATN